MPLNLFPSRAAIGQVRGTDVYMTTEFARALADLLVRVGGPDGASISELQKDLARRPSTLAQTGLAVRHTGTADSTVLARVKVPADAMGKNGAIRISTVWSVSNNENEKTVINRFGGDEVSRNAVTTVSTYQEQQAIYNRNSTTEQVFIFGGFSYTGTPISTLRKDTGKIQYVEIAAQLSDPNDSITLEAYTVELIPTI